jgi:hypothetical protein
MTQDLAQPSAPAPDPTVWDDVRCPLCAYDLRGLAEPRCPECGYRFTWEELTDPAVRLHPYLFEHHPERNAGSFWQTLVGGLRPGPFWRKVYPTQPSRPRRLLAYWLLAALPLVVTLLGVYGHRGWTGGREMAAQRPIMQQLIATNPAMRNDLIRAYGSIERYYDTQVPLPSQWQFYRNLYRNHYWNPARPFDKLAVTLVAWPWLTALSLMVFRISMRRARIRPVHVLRCVLYAADGVFWAGLLTAAAVGLQMFRGAELIVTGFPDLSAPAPFFLAIEPDLATAVIYLCCVAGVLFMAYRLTVAFGHYLRFDRPVATVLASQVIVFLVAWIALTNWGISL